MKKFKIQMGPPKRRCDYSREHIGTDITIVRAINWDYRDEKKVEFEYESLKQLDSLMHSYGYSDEEIDGVVNAYFVQQDFGFPGDVR